MADEKHNSFLKSTQEKDERLEALKQLYPELFADGKLNIDVLKEVTGLYNPQEERTPGYYGLYWPGKREAKIEAKASPKGTLVPVPGDGVDEERTHNIYIEGDNLEVLRILRQSYKGRVKMIYIDPPYNTGNDFIYPDNYKMAVDDYLSLTGQTDDKGKALTTNQKSNGAFHTKWLNMMLPRLMLARELLTEDGFMLVSVDYNENYNARQLLNEVFGEENFVGEIYWESKTKSQNTTTSYNKLQPKAEMIFVYSKDGIQRFNLITIGKKEYPLKDDRGEYRDYALELMNANGIRGRETMVFDISDGVSTVSPPVGKQWKLGQDQVATYKNAGDLFIRDGKVIIKMRPEYERNETTEPFWGFFPKELGTAESAKKELNALLENHGFETVKPIEILRRLIHHTTEKDSLILDFFSGSASTAHAVFVKNLEDSGRRKFIMIQLPENAGERSAFSTICEIGKERIRRAGAKIREEMLNQVQHDKTAIQTGGGMAKPLDGSMKGSLFDDGALRGVPAEGVGGNGGAIAAEGETSPTSNNCKLTADHSKLDTGFRVYRLAPTNFTTFTPTTGQDEKAQSELFAELEKNETPLVENWNASNVLTEIILKQGFALDCECVKADSFAKNTVYRIKDSEGAARRTTVMYVCLDAKIEEETISALTLEEKEKFVCLDAAIDDTSYARLCDKGRIETI